ncbi:unnamed protein product [Fusarium graminearum]|uniref:Uncharacterized protein n=1 Tax=Gibberella zeae TaxID=5518 RepID=A0A4E9ERM4_GIBZA|nr:unnamed protein product [Fusarium graminearum]
MCSAMGARVMGSQDITVDPINFWNISSNEAAGSMSDKETNECIDPSFVFVIRLRFFGRKGA